MNCATRLVELFGSQADVARAFQLDRAVVHNWVKTGYVPARWAGEVERITQGRIRSEDIVNEASAKNPVRVKSRPDDAQFGILSESDPLIMSTSQYAPSKRIHSFHPPQRTLMGPGPTEIHPRVLTTMSQPAIGYLDPVFVEMMEELKSLLRYVYQTKNNLTFPLSGPGSVGMEYCFVNMVRPGDKVVVGVNGVFGGRMVENVERMGGVPIVVADDWGKTVDPQKVEDAFRKNRDAKVLAFVHAETSTGSPHLSSIRIGVPPARTTFSSMRPPNTPFWHTITLSPGATMLTKQYSMPTEPGPESGKVSAFLVWYT